MAHDTNVSDCCFSRKQNFTWVPYRREQHHYDQEKSTKIISLTSRKKPCLLKKPTPIHDFALNMLPLAILFLLSHHNDLLIPTQNNRIAIAPFWNN